MAEGHGEDLAHIHDAGFGDIAAAASEWQLRSLGIAKGTLTDLGVNTPTAP